ncbi:MAG: helix-turn-helix domain-containing protein [Gammaproteobacteria bacterium]|nr:helix-turn-helix domain-containing protein [Gammaproteobacteria bacterium]
MARATGMGTAMDHIRAIGQNIRRQRKIRGLTLTQLAATVGLSQATLSKIENGQTRLNYDNVKRLAAGLETPVATLLGPEADGAAALGNRFPVARRAFTASGAGSRHETDRLVFEALCDDLKVTSNVYFRVGVLARSLEQFGALSRHPGEEFFTVLRGAICFHSEYYKDLPMQTGDSVCFDAMMGHAYVAVGDETPELLMVNTLPGHVGATLKK